jgi:hypothetical protein
MASHPANDLVARQLVALGLSPALLPDPEVLKADLARIQCKTLASVIAGLIAEYEPMLKAEADGATVIVAEIGGGTAMKVTIETIREREAGNRLPSSS